MSKTLEMVVEFQRKYPLTISWWRKRKHSAIIDRTLTPGEKIIYAFAAQENEDGHWIDTAVLALTTKRIIVAKNRILPGFRVISVEAKFFNDVKISSGLIWGVVRIDTMKERISFGKIQRKALIEIKNTITKCMTEYKKQIPDDLKNEMLEPSEKCC